MSRFCKFGKLHVTVSAVKEKIVSGTALLF